MIVDEKLARYILELQSVADGERSMSDSDIAVQNRLEEEFPCLKDEREDQEFRDWLWTEKVGQDSRVMNIHTYVNTLTLQDQLEVLYYIEDVRSYVEAELLQRVGEENLKLEWRASLIRKENRCQSDISA